MIAATEHVVAVMMEQVQADFFPLQSDRVEDEHRFDLTAQHELDATPHALRFPVLKVIESFRSPDEPVSIMTTGWTFHATM